MSVWCVRMSLLTLLFLVLISQYSSKIKLSKQLPAANSQLPTANCQLPTVKLPTAPPKINNILHRHCANILHRHRAKCLHIDGAILLVGKYRHRWYCTLYVQYCWSVNIPTNNFGPMMDQQSVWCLLVGFAPLTDQGHISSKVRSFFALLIFLLLNY